MTEELIKEVKHIQRCLINKDMTGDEWEEKMEIVHKLRSEERRVGKECRL